MSDTLVDTTRAGHRWADRRRLAAVLRLVTVLAPIASSVGFVALATRVVARPTGLLAAALWWVGLTAASTVVLVLVERAMRKFLPLVALFRLSLAFPDEAPSRFKVAMRTNTLRQLQRTLAEGRRPTGELGAQDGAERLVALATALNAHDRMTRGHTERVRAYTLMIGEELGLDRDELDRLHWAGLVHDIGKLEVPTEILNKNGRPSDEEWRVLQRHPAAGVPLVEPLRPWLGEWIDAASQHHERWDGKGYPFGLAGTNISYAGRIVAVADAFDVMTSVRSYKKAMTAEDARAELARCAGTQFDPQVVRAFLNLGLGRLRVVMGPLAWLANTPLLSRAPVASAPAGNAVSALAALAVAAVSGVLGSPPSEEPANVAAARVIAAPVRVVVAEDQPIVIDLGDANGQAPTTWSVVESPPHLTLDRSADRLRFLPDLHFNGRTTGRYSACWGRSCSSAPLVIDIEPVNDEPVVVADQYAMREDDTIDVDPTVNDTDVEDGRPRLTLVDPTVLAVRAAAFTGPTDAEVSVTSAGLLRVRPAPDFFGTLRVRYTAADRDGAQAQGDIDVVVRPVDDAPQATSDRVNATGAEQATFNVVVNDADVDGDTIRIVGAAIVVGSGTLTHDGARLYFTPGAGPLQFAVLSYTIEDQSGRRATAFVYVSVLPSASQPVALDDPAAVVEDDGWTPIRVLDNDLDADGPITDHTLRVVDAPTSGSAAVSAEAILYRPAPDRVGVDAFRYEVCDPTGLCDTALVTVTIDPINDAPSFVAGPARVTNEDSGTVVFDGWASDVSPGPPDEVSQRVTFTVTASRADLFAGPPSIDPAGALRFTTAPNAHGTAVLRIVARDDGGTAAGGLDSSTPLEVTLTIISVNDPVLAADDAAAVDEDTALGVTVDVLANDTDIDADPLSIVAIDASTVSGTVSQLSGGQIRYVPAENLSGTETFGYTVSDGRGSTASATVTVTVNPTPDAPVAIDDSFATDEGVALVQAAPGLLFNDFDEDEDTLTVTTTAVSGPASGTLSLAASGAFTYTPNPGFVGTDSFVYQVNDGTGRSAIATVSITVDSGLSPGVYYLGTTFTAGTWGLETSPLATVNPEPDHDVDGELGFTLEHGSGDPGDLGADKNRVWSRDVTGQALELNGPATLELWSTVKDFQPNKTAHPVVYLYDCDTLGIGCVTIAETDRHIDPYNAGVAGWVSVDIPLGNVTYTVPVGRQLRVRVQVRHEDIWIAASGARPSELRFTIANSAPVAVDDSPPAILEDAAPTILAVLGNDVDANLVPSSVTVTVSPTRGTAVANLDGTVTYTPTGNANGTDAFTYRVCDTGGLCDTAVVNLTITAVNDAPSFTGGADVTVAVGSPPYTASGWATAITTGPTNESAQTAVFSLIVSDPTLFAVQPAISATGTLTFTPNGVFTGFADIQVTLIDNGGTSNGGANTSVVRTFRITVSP